MAIIRKGDKVAEAKLKARAEEQDKGRKSKTFTSKDPGRIKVSKDSKSGKAKATTMDVDMSKSPSKFHTKKYTKPVSGRDVADSSAARTSSSRFGGSGVIQSGKLVKGGNPRLGDELDRKKNK